ncbi:MAG: FKBP-type peptidyl-prolyl cis-trans isomerase [Mucilaginibacter sp.]
MKKITLMILLATAVTAVQAQDEFTHAPKGVLVKNVTKNAGAKIKLDDVLTFDVTQKTEKDSILFSSYMMGHAATVRVQPAQNAGDLMDVFPLLTAKDSAYIKVPTDSIFVGHEEQRPPFLPKGSYIIYNLKIRRVQSLNDAMAERNKLLDSMRTAESVAAAKYIGDNKLAMNTTPSGLKYLVTKPSLKPKPLMGDTVLVNYTGYTLDGKVFDSSIAAEAQKAGLNQPGRNYEPISFDIGTVHIIQGWNEGFLLLNEGSKAKLIIPSNLGYGDQGSPDGRITPFSTLVFDVELVKIKPIKHPAAPKPAAQKPAAKKGVVKKHTTTTKKSS